MLVVAAVLQIVALCAPWYESIQNVAMFPSIVWCFYLTKVRVEINMATSQIGQSLKKLDSRLIGNEFKPCGGQKNMDQVGKEWNKESMKARKQLAVLKQIEDPTADEVQEIEALEEEIPNIENDEKKKLFMNSGTWCATIPLHRVFMSVNNDFWHWLHVYNPNFPLFNAAGYAIFFGGMICMLLGILMSIGLLMAAAFLYYYAEHKATKKARKIALTFVTVAMGMGLIVLLTSTFTLFIAGKPTTAMPLVSVVTPRSPSLPVWGWLMELGIMIVVGVITCFSKFWKLRRVENLRREEKNIEREQEFFKAIGMNPESEASDSSLMSSSEFSDSTEDEREISRGPPRW